ncbi:MAG: hypothetical protein RJB38_1487 [Pseudomonadota bacterium]|jgi:dolichol kinase
MRRKTSQISEQASIMGRVFSAGAVRIPVRLHLRQDLHLTRKLWHMLTGLMMVTVFLSGLSRFHAVLILGSVLGLCLLVEVARLRVPSINEAVIRLWGPIMRSGEIDRMSGTPYYLASALIAVGLFPKPIAALSLLFLACGDPMASLVGILYGKNGPRWADGKSWIGTSAGVLTCMVLGALFWNALPVRAGQAWALTWVGGVAGGMAELLPWDIDDNFVIPVVSGFTLWMACLLLGVPV